MPNPLHHQPSTPSMWHTASEPTAAGVAIFMQLILAAMPCQVIPGDMQRGIYHRTYHRSRSGLGDMQRGIYHQRPQVFARSTAAGPSC